MKDVDGVLQHAEALIAARQYARAAPLLELLAGVDAGEKTTRIQLLHAATLLELRRFEGALVITERIFAADKEASAELVANVPVLPQLDDSCTPHPADVEGCDPRKRHILTLQQSFDANTIAMRCLLELSSWKECAGCAERALNCAQRLHERSEATPATQSAEVDALCALAACTEAVGGNVQRAAELYCRALELDPLCAAAMDALLNHKLIAPSELVTVINALQLPPECEALRTLYKARTDADPSRASPSFTTATVSSSGGEPGDHGMRHNDGVGAGSGNGDGTSAAAGACASLEARDPPSVSLLQSAKYYHRRAQYRAALRCTTELLRLLPFQEDAVTLHLAILVDMRETAALFSFAHSLVDRRPHQALSLYAVGCYYYLLCSYERAGRFFSKATELAPTFPHAWLAYAHCYAQLEEGEQALAVYRRALTSFPGLHACGTYLGMQYQRIQNVTLAMCFLEDARRKAPNDTLLLNEIGVLYVRVKRLQEAHEFFTLALQSLPNPKRPSQYEDCVIFNLATVKRKLQMLPAALELFTQFSMLRPNSAQGHCALGFTHHLLGQLREAIGCYHTSLAIKPDAFCRDMLDRAVADEYSTGVGGAEWGLAPDAAGLPLSSPVPKHSDADGASLAGSSSAATTAVPPFRSVSTVRGTSSSPAVEAGRTLTF